MRPWYVWLMDLLAGAFTKERLGGLTSDKDAVAGALTGQVALPTLSGDRDSEDDAKREAMVAFMRSSVGDDYVFGAEIRDDEADPKAGDCSEYMEAAHHRAGLEYPDGCVYQKAFMRGRRVRAPKPGDAFFYGPNQQGIPHTGMYEGGGWCIHALGGKGVVRQPLVEVEGHPRFEGWWRHPDLAWPAEERA